MVSFYKELQKAFELLKEQNTLLVAENKLLKTTVADLKSLVSEMSVENKLLKATIADLKEGHSKLIQENHQLKEKLGLNSTNSSLPPSRDLYVKKQKNKPKSHRKPGGQPGHPANTYQSLPPDKIINCLPKTCPCGHHLEKTDKFVKEQKIEIPFIKPEVTDYIRWYGKCAVCKTTKLAPLPKGVQSDLLGPHLKTIICSLNGFYHNSKREVQDILSQIFHLNISLGLISNTAKRVNKQLGVNYEGLQEEIASSPYMHIDETGHKNKGKRGWAWVFTNKDTTVLHISSSRGKKVLAEVLGNYEGYVISDRYGAYNYFDENKRQICWSHLQRDFERFAHSLHPELLKKGKRLVEISQKVFSLVGNYIRDPIGKVKLSSRVIKLKDELKEILESILKLSGTKHAHGVAGNLLKSFGMMWRFLEVEGIEMTNNLAERQIRKYVIYPKKLLFTWSDWGNQFVERVLSLFLTCRLQNTSPFMQLYQAISNLS